MWRVREWLAFLWPPHWWYSWTRAAHVLDNGCAWCTPGTRCTCRPEPELVYVDPYGSMILAEERALTLADLGAMQQAVPDGCGCPTGECHGRSDCWLDSLIEDGGAPDWREQTAADLSPEALDDALMTSTNDSGPGVLSLVPPGPDPERLCGPEQPHEKPAGTESAGSGHMADAWLDGQLAELYAWVRAQWEEAAA